MVVRNHHDFQGFARSFKRCIRWYAACDNNIKWCDGQISQWICDSSWRWTTDRKEFIRRYSEWMDDVDTVAQELLAVRTSRGAAGDGWDFCFSISLAVPPRGRSVSSVLPLPRLNGILNLKFFSQIAGVRAEAEVVLAHCCGSFGSDSFL